MTQSHKCAYLHDYDRCTGEEWCQYKLTTAYYPLGEIFCGKDQILRTSITPEWLSQALNEGDGVYRP
jgi:hypothetical protein